ncbi:MAG: GGDEF domain-containing protein [Kineosporiaceae bacterium]|nr:GGDEF domain-containing protein [Aeromicrobium sp.]
MTSPDGRSDPEESRDGPNGDPETVLLSREELRGRLDVMVAADGRAHVPVSVILLDMDGLETIRAGLGNQVSEAVLGQISDRLRSTVRHGDFVGHVGGEEFVILCDGIGIDVSTRVAERMLALTRRSLDNVPTRFQVRTSIGVASSETISGVVPTADEMIAQAVAAMRESKRRGANHVIAVAGTAES